MMARLSLAKILHKDTYAFGYDAQTGEYGNLVSKGLSSVSTSSMPKSFAAATCPWFGLQG
jgi:hypothetical protein